MPFTPEELAEIAAADAEIDATFHLEQADIDLSEALDAAASPKKQRAARKKAYYQANREKILAQKKEYRKANLEAISKYQRSYRDAHREQFNAYMREYMRKKRAAAKRARLDSGRKE